MPRGTPTYALTIRLTADQLAALDALVTAKRAASNLSAYDAEKRFTRASVCGEFVVRGVQKERP